MPPQYPSIQSFFPLSSSPSKPPTLVKASPNDITSDGFTEKERELLQPLATEWIPAQDYDEVEIRSLRPGPQCVTFMGRVTNFHDQSNSSKMPHAAKGYAKIIVKDDFGALTVRLWYANKDYKLQLGHLVSVWTSHISRDREHDRLPPSSASLFVSIFPERDRSCHFMVHMQSDEGKLCKTPLGYVEGTELSGLMTMQNFIDGGYEVVDRKILVCVKSIGAKKKLNNKKGGVSELVSVGIFDHTAEATLTLWGAALSSVNPWQPSKTVLLISNAGFKTDRRNTLSLVRNTYIDVNPAIPDAEWLRRFAQKLTKRDHVNPAFPKGLFDLETTLAAPTRPLYHLAEIDDLVRDNPTDLFTGFLSVIILDFNITTLHLRNMLLCTECCGVPMFANSIVAKCKQCEQASPMRINPHLVGTIVDETGSITPGKLIWSREAWEQLLGRTAEELAGSSSELLRYLEKRLSFLRVTLVFGWAGEDISGGRLMVLGVRM